MNRRSLAIGDQGDDVRLLQAQLNREGIEVPEAEVAQGHVGPGTREAVRKIQEKYGLPVTGVADPGLTATLENGQILKPRRRASQVKNAASNSQAHDGYLVEGSVVHADGSPVMRVSVVVLEKRLRGEHALGKVRTDEQGRFKVVYRQPEKLPISILVRASDPNGAEIAVSNLICDTGPVEEVTLVVGGETLRGPSEYEQLEVVLRPALTAEQLDPADLNEEDVTFLARKFDLNPEHVAYLVVSTKFGKETDIPIEVFYGLLRQNLPTDLASLLAQTPDDLRRALETSITENIVGRHLQDAIPRHIKSLQAQIIRLALRDPEPDRPTFKAFLDIAGVPRERSERILKDYLKHEGSIKELWQALRERDDTPNQEIDDLQDTLRLGGLSLKHQPLMQELMRLRHKQNQSLRHLLSRFNEDDWRQLIEQERDGKRIGAPQTLGDDEKERISRYVAYLPRMVAGIYPTAVLSHQLEQVDREKFAPVVDFINRTEIEFRDTRLRDYLKDHPDEFDEEADSDKIALLKTTERLFRVTPPFQKGKTVAALIAKGIQSEVDIRRQGVVRFTRENSGLLGGNQEAQLTYNRAARQVDTALLVLSQSPVFNPINIVYIPSHLFGTGIPDLETLFGSLDLCKCEHCASVYSPAAYLVDILHFLMNRPASPKGRVALDVLNDRRPDIGLIELNCHNTHTPLPYVDLVLEILENAVATDDPSGNLQAENEEGHPSWFQTTETAEVLGATPEHILEAAYDTLAAAVYPWQMPFDLWTTETRIYLEHLGVSRYELMTHFHRDNEPPQPIYIAAEHLSLTRVDQDIITGSTNNSTRVFWGLGLQAWSNLLAERQVPAILNQSGLAYGELSDLLEVSFVRGDRSPRIEFEQPDCNVDDAIVVNLDEGVLDRMHRFVRLQQKLGWPTHELSMVLAIMEADDLDDDQLVQLSQIKELRQNLKVQLETMLSWWSLRLTIRESDDERFLYERIFLDPTINNPNLKDLELNTAKNELESFSQNSKRSILSPDYAPIVYGALGISADELTHLVEDELSSNELNLSNLTRLYQAVSLARVLKFAIHEYLWLRAQTDIDPFGPNQVAETIRFIEQVRRVRDSGFNIPTLDYLLQHRYTPSSVVASSDQEIVIFLNDLRTGLHQIAADHSISAEEPLASQMATHLALLLPDEALGRVIALLDLTATDDQASQEALIDEHFAAFLNPDEVKNHLVGEGTSQNSGDLSYVEDRFRYVLVAVLAHLKQLASRNLVIQSVASLLSLDFSVAQGLLTKWVSVPADASQQALNIFLVNTFIGGAENAENETEEDLPITLGNFPVQFATFRLLEKIAIFLNTLKIPTDAVEFLFTDSRSLNWLDLNHLPVATVVKDAKSSRLGLSKMELRKSRSIQKHSSSLFETWAQTTEILHAGRSLPGGLLTLFDLLIPLNQPGDTLLTRAQFLDLLAERSGWSRDDVDFLTGPTGLAYEFPADFLDGQWLVQLGLCFKLLKRLGVSAAEVWNWAAPSVSSAIARTIKQTVRGKYDESQWLALAKPIRDGLREQQRGALVTYQLHHISKPRRLRNANELYAKYLIDVEMDPCMMTSRIKQAISSVQLFVQRCLMNLEPSVELTRDDAKEWEWMKNYRVWEANRKVFLYPENWIEPELRDDKTPFFVDLESGLQQDEMKESTVERELLKYLEKLNNVAQLDISGLYHQHEPDQEIVHVFARSRNIPRTYYYRKWVNQRSWTAWEKVDADIEGDHLVPVVWNRRLYLFWPIFEERDIEIEKTTAISVTNDQGSEENREVPTKEILKYYEIQIAWIEYKDNKWSSKQVTDEVIDTFPKPDLDSKDKFTFWSSFNENQNLVINFAGEGGATWQQFRFNGCNGKLERLKRWSLNGPIYFPFLAPLHTIPYRNSYKEEGSHALHLTTSARYQENANSGWYSPEDSEISNPIFYTTPGTYRIIPSHAERPLISRLSFFYQDNNRTFFVIPTASYTGGWESTGDLTIGINWDDAVPMELPDVATKLVGSIPHLLPSRAGSSTAVFHPEIPDSSNLPLARDTLTSPGEAGLRAKPNIPRITADNLDVVKANSLARVRPILSGGQANAQATLSSQWQWGAKYFRFENFYHPYVCLLIEQLNRHGIEGIYASDPQKEPTHKRRKLAEGLRRQMLSEAFFHTTYTPNHENVLNINGLTDNEKKKAGPLEEFDFSYSGAYSIYNWELFFHAPFMLAKRLCENQKFEEAQKWFHFIFNPTYIPENPFKESWPARFWQIKPFFEYGVGKSIQQTMLLLKSSGLTKDEKEARKLLREQIEAWRQNPFNPHLIARLRPEAYMKTVVMAYIDCLIAWGDNLFRRDSIESINEATQLYILAAEILRERPREIPGYEGTKKTNNGEEVKTFNDLKERLDDFSNVLVQLVDIIEPMEADTEGSIEIGELLRPIGFKNHADNRDSVDFADFSLSAAIEDDDDTSVLNLSSAGPVPANGDNDNVANFPLGAAIEDDDEPPGPRESFPTFEASADYNALGSKASIPTVEISPFALGPTLFFCIPKNDKLLQYWDTVEDRLFKIRHCMNIEGVTRQLPLFQPPIDPGLLVKAVAARIDISSALNDLNAPLLPYRFQVLQQKVSELVKDVISLGASLLAALEKRDAETLALLRANHEIKLLEAVTQIRERQIEEAEEQKRALEESREAAEFRSTHYADLLSTSLIGGEVQQLVLTQLVKIAQHLSGASSVEASEIAYKQDDYSASVGSSTGVSVSVTASVPPSTSVGASLGTSTGSGTSWGGTKRSSGTRAKAEEWSTSANTLQTQASLSGINSNFSRREQEWDFQKNVADKDVLQLDKQIEAAKIRIELANNELNNHEIQIENAKQVDGYMRSKYTNQELYNWMVSQISSIYFQSYQLAYDLAKRAEKAFQYELGVTDTNYIQFGYWDSLKKGLLSGEKLHHDLKRMEVAYLEEHRREFELTKHVSLAMLNPIQLLRFKQDGRCEIECPESLFDLDYPGQYFRRIKSVSITVPAVTGPYTTVSCTLRFLRSSIRRQSTLFNGQYARDLDNDDPRFSDSIGAIQSIATSSGQNDSGLFELNFRDERYLPFEGAGAISLWQLEMPNEFRQFDYDSISDVILHINYTAREGGGVLREAANQHLRDGINTLVTGDNAPGLHQSISARHEFPTEFHRFLHPAIEPEQQTLTLNLAQNRFPYMFKGRDIIVDQVYVFVQLADEFIGADVAGTEFTLIHPGGEDAVDLDTASSFGNVRQVSINNINSTPGEWTLAVFSVGDGLTDESNLLNSNAIEDIILILHYMIE